jgi:hypothetical protein
MGIKTFEIKEYICDGCNKELLPYDKEMAGNYLTDTRGNYVGKIVFIPEKCYCDECLATILARGIKVKTSLLYKEDVDKKVKDGVNY